MQTADTFKTKQSNLYFKPLGFMVYDAAKVTGTCTLLYPIQLA